MTQEEMQVLKQMFESSEQRTEKRMQNMIQENNKTIEEMITVKLQPIQETLDALSEDIAEIKEEATITRHNVNLLLSWAERADRSINVGLYDSGND